MIQLGVLGSRGRMGKWVVELASEEFGEQLKVVSQPGSRDKLDPLLKTDVVIDFSSSAAMTRLAQHALESDTKHLPAFVVGSTGWTDAELKTLDELAQKTPVLLASNFSSGVFVVSKILKEFAPLLSKIGYTPVLVETHHIHKKDAPSGTAKTLQASIDSTNPSGVQTLSVRAGEVIGDHEVTFYSSSEQIKISHSATDRSIWARGAIQVALWLTHAKKKNSKLAHGIIGIEKYFESI